MDNSPSNFIDRVFGDRYRIQALLGHQTGRRTFLALDLKKEHPVVLKLLLFGPDFTWDDLKLFEREAEVLKSLDLPAIPHYLDCFDVNTELGKGFMLVQTYIEAKSLQHWLDAGRTFSEEELIAIAKSLLAILDYLHSRQPAVIHRDIKPSNILLGDRSGNSPGEVYLVDFGSVKTAVASTTITVVGTYGYMPPEQFGGMTTPASDLYALGATMICLATGQHPSELPQRDLRIMFADALSEGLHQRVNLTPHLIDWLKWMTVPSVDSRIKSASEALAVLDPANIKEGTAIGIEPFSGKVKMQITGDVTEILIPPQGFNLAITLFSIIYTTLVGFFLMVSIINAYSFAWLSLGSAFYIFLILLSSTCLLVGGRMLLLAALFDWGGTQKIRFDRSKISLSTKIFGFKSSPSFSLNRQDVTKLEFVPLTYTKSNGELEANFPKLNIWAGTKKLTLTATAPEYGRLSESEIQWLANELEDWIDLPKRISTGNKKEI
jgi:serine/threonine protein kinase